MTTHQPGDAWEDTELIAETSPATAKRLRLLDTKPASELYRRTHEQATRATERLDEDFSQCPRMPWDSVNRVIGHGLLPDQFWVLAASSGHGKSTALMNLLTAWVQEGRRVYMLPLEQPTDVMRIYWAALDLGYPTRFALKNAWKALPSDAKQRLAEHLHWQCHEGADQVHFSDEPFVNEEKLVRAMEEAAEFCADVVIIDHLHQFRLEGRDRYGAWESMCQRVKELCKRFRIPVFGAAQINERKQKGDRLRAFFPPQADDIQNGKVLEQVADVVMAAFRPLRADLTAGEMKAARLGAPIKPCLAVNQIGLHVLKSRIEGDIGDVLGLQYRGGRITCYETEERLQRLAQGQEEHRAHS